MKNTKCVICREFNWEHLLQVSLRWRHCDVIVMLFWLNQMWQRCRYNFPVTDIAARCYANAVLAIMQCLSVRVYVTFVHSVKTNPVTSTWPHLRCDVGLEEGRYWKKLSLCYSIVYCYNGAQRYEQFLQVGRLYRALILLGLGLSSKHLCVFGLYGVI